MVQFLVLVLPPLNRTEPDHGSTIHLPHRCMSLRPRTSIKISLVLSTHLHLRTPKSSSGPYFIAYGLHHTRWSCSQPCLKVHFPIAQGFSGYKLFVSAFMLASSKVICDYTYSNTSWSIVVRVCFSFGRSIRWRERCASTWS
jgi:hypothetical protein